MSQQSDIKRPDLSHIIRQDDGTKKEIFWSYGVQMDIQRMIPDASVVVEVMTSDPITRDFVVRRCFTEQKRSIEKLEDFEVDVPVSDPDEIEKLLTWVADHLFYFFTKSVRSMTTLGERYRNALPTVKETTDQPAPSTNGSEA